MGQQILILALTGTHNPALPSEITQMLSQRGLEIRHACLTYQGLTAFAIGTPDALASELAEAGHEVQFIPQALASGGVTNDGITLETINAHLLDVKRLLEKEKAPKPRAKKEGPAPDTKEPGPRGSAENTESNPDGEAVAEGIAGSPEGEGSAESSSEVAA